MECKEIFSKIASMDVLVDFALHKTDVSLTITDNAIREMYGSQTLAAILNRCTQNASKEMNARPAVESDNAP